MSQFELNIAGILSQSLAQMEAILNRQPIDYKVAVSNQIHVLEQDVKQAISEGWQPIGSMVTHIDESRCDPAERHVFIREMVKYGGNA